MVKQGDRASINRRRGSRRGFFEATHKKSEALERFPKENVGISERNLTVWGVKN